MKCFGCDKMMSLTPCQQRRNRKFCSLECKRQAHPSKRFWLGVDRKTPGECWPWKRASFVNGYGCFRVKHNNILAHRFAWQDTNGPIPDGKMICHSCDNPPCCNPAHLFPGTAQDNVDDMTRKGRKVPPRGEKNHWHKLTEDDVEEIRNLWPGASKKEIGAAFGVHAMTIHAVLTRKSWKHLP